MPKPWQNKSGLPDPTAYHAQQELSDEEERVTDLVHIFRIVAKWAGFRIVNRIEFQHLRSGRTYR